MIFYILPTQEHPNKQGKYALIREGTLKLFTGASYDETPDDERLLKQLNLLDKNAEVVEFKVKNTAKTKVFKVMLEHSDTYQQNPLDPNIPTRPCLYNNKKHPQTLRFPKLKQARANIGIIKAYKKDSLIQTFLPDIDSLSNPHNEIYTIDIEQEIQLRAFVYEEQKTKVEKDNVKDQKTQIAREYKEEQGNITKTIITKAHRFNDIAEKNIQWAFKIVEGTYLANNKRHTAFPPLGDKQIFRILNDSATSKDSNNETTITPKLTSIPQGYVELENKIGDCVNLRLRDIFDESLLNPNNQETLINKNIIFFAYDKSLGINTSTDTLQNAYHIYQDSGKKKDRIITQDRVTSIELKILQTRFSLEFDGEYLSLYENQRTIGEWEARSGIPLENLKEDSVEYQQRQRFAIPAKDNTSFYYDINLHKEDSTKPIQEGKYMVSLSKNTAPHRWVGDDTFGKYRFTLYSTNTQGAESNNTTAYSIHGGKELGDTQGIDLAQNMKDCYKSINKIAGHIDSIPLKVSYQKRVVIIIERFRQTTESTTARMNIFIDRKRVDSNGNIIGEKTQQYEYYNPNALPTENPYAYILERSGPDSIGGEIKLRIPSGRYEIAEWHYEQKDTDPKNNTPNLANDFVHQGRHILIHIGNSPKDSAGCLLINKTDNNVENTLADSTPAKEYFTSTLQDESGIRKYLNGIDKDEIIKHIIMIIK